jgi:CheY-like chemotaxis protein
MRRILLVEDNAVIASAYWTKLQVEGFLVEVAGDGQAALDAVDRFKPELVLLDLQLPVVSGLEVLRRIRSVPQSPPLPVIVFTQSLAPEMLKEAWEAGATQVVSKATSTPNQIIRAVKAALGGVGGG